MPFQAILNDHRHLIHPPKVFIRFLTHRLFDHIKKLVKYSNASTSYLNSMALFNAKSESVAIFRAKTKLQK